MLTLLRYVPKNLLSRVVGRLARLRRPRWLVVSIQRWFVRRYGLVMEEASRPLEEYGSLLDLFTRTLKEGVRPIAAGEGTLVSPVDAAVGAHGEIRGGRLIQAKGLDYALSALLGSQEEAEAMEGGHFATLYLAPTDYHRIHSPVDGRIVATTYLPGTLWPVNGEAVSRIPSLFAVNERVATKIEVGGGVVHVVMVGATNVGSIRLSYEDLVTNRPGGRLETRRHERGLPVARGDELGVFELGSTVILLTSPGAFQSDPLEEGRPVRLGERLGISR